jgi:urease accessory protein
MGLPETMREDHTGWHAELMLDFARQGERTVLAHRRHSGPLQIQRTFHPEGDTCHAYILHPPGGVVGGDRLDIDITLATGSAALITTPAAGKFYRSDGRIAEAGQRLRVAAGAQLEWLPQETILFDDARARLSTRVELEGDAAFIGWEMLCLGRPASDAPFAAGAVRQHFELWREGRPLWLERAQYDGGAAALDARWGLAGRTVSATLVATIDENADTGLIEAVYAAALPRDGELFSATRLDRVLVCRYLGDAALRARDVFAAAWCVLRPALLGKPACAPRIWAT